jgi:hypothetical protein
VSAVALVVESDTSTAAGAAELEVEGVELPEGTQAEAVDATEDAPEVTPETDEDGN